MLAWLNKHKTALITASALALFMGVALSIRIIYPYDSVFRGEWIKFTSIDAYYYMRLVDNLAYNFPYLTHFDPYFAYPSGGVVMDINFFAWILAGTSWVVGLGNPSPHTVDMVGVYMPPILAALTVVPVYFIGKMLFNRWAGIIAAGLLAVMAGEFLGRSILGFADHHVAETLLSTTCIMFFIMALKQAGRKIYLWSTLAGICLGIYLLTWVGGMLLVFIFALYLVAQFVVNHLKGTSSVPLCRVSVVMLLIACVMYVTATIPVELRIGMIAVVVLPVVLLSLSYGLKKYRPMYYPMGLAGVGVVLFGIVYLITPSMLNAITGHLSTFIPSSQVTTMEMQPILSPQGEFTLLMGWHYFTTVLYLAPLGLVVVMWAFIRNKGNDSAWLFLLVWTVVMIVATIAQRRFAYYLVVNFSLLTAFLSWQIIWFFGLKRRFKIGKVMRPNYVLVFAVSVVVFFLAAYPNIMQSKNTASQPQFMPSDGWQSALLWMKHNTPEPLKYDYLIHGGYRSWRQYDGVYYDICNINYNYSDSAYGVTAWWDYGYWISRIAHRIPNVNPTQTAEPVKTVAKLFLSNGNTSDIMKELGSSYVITDYAVATTKFHAVIKWAGRDASEYAGLYYVPHEGKLMPVELYYPEYYRSLFVRLYNFNGMGVIDERPLVINYVGKTDAEGRRYNEIIGYGESPTYEDAVQYINKQNGGNWRVVGVNQFISPIKLEAVSEYELVYASEFGIQHRDVWVIPEVKIFEYVG